jgi:hypothetical protein
MRCKKFNTLFIATFFVFAMTIVYLPLHPAREDYRFTNVNAALLISNKKLPTDLRISGLFIWHLNEYYHRFFPHIILAFLSIITTIDVLEITYLPISVFLVFLSLFLILEKITTSMLARALFAVYYFVILAMMFMYIFCYITFGLSLFILLAYLLIRNEGDISFKSVLIFNLLFIAMTLSYYTSAVLAIVLTFLYGLRRKNMLLSINFLFTFITVELILCSRTIILTILPDIVRAPLQRILFYLQEYFLKLITTTVQSKIYTVFNPYLDNPIIQILGFINRAFIMLYVFIGLILNVHKIKKISKVKFIQDEYFWFILTFIISGFFEDFIYILANYGIMQRITTIALIFLMAYLWPDEQFKIQKNDFAIHKFLAALMFIIMFLLIPLNFMRSYTFSIIFGIDYGNFLQKVHHSLVFFLAFCNKNIVYSDHITGSILTYKAIQLDIKYNLKILVLTAANQTLASDSCIILPHVKAVSSGWEGFIPLSDFLSLLKQKDIIYASNFFTIYIENADSLL